MTDTANVEALLARILEVQTAVLKLLALPLVEDEKARSKKALKLRETYGFSVDLLSDITGARADNLRTTFESAGVG